MFLFATWQTMMDFQCAALPVEGCHCTDGQQHVEQRLGGIRHALVLLKQVGQGGEVLPS